ncbi:unnamed protein product [Danaus chrysippus]|uniref:(African queen) hypothetical protein n=1 Tax=Danaus chrysippus TaxID=151541 RepID=A0A8J2W683_9NEOP|nr:unnamed protein product [Danaus chrysippus]
MSIFGELLPKLEEISNAYIRNFDDDLEAAFLALDKFKEEYLNSKSKSRDKNQKDKNHTTILQSIHEDEDETPKADEPIHNTEQRSKKRSKHEVEGMESPEIEKRPKRNASIKAQSVISKQVNQNLTEKLRRENSTQSRRRRKDDDKENEPAPILQIKLEKISIVPEPIDIESVPVNIEVKQERKEEVAMPPPPVPKPRRKVDKPEENDQGDTERRRTTRNRKQTDSMTSQTAPRPVRSSRARLTEQEDKEGNKRTRGKKAQETSTVEAEKDTVVENETASPAEKPRPKRTRRARKVSEKQDIENKTENDNEKQENEVEIKAIDTVDSEMTSPVLQKIIPKTKHRQEHNIEHTDNIDNKEDEPQNDMEKTRILQLNSTVTISNMNSTMILPQAMYQHAPGTPQAVNKMNETVVIETGKEEKNKVMNETVVLEKVSDKAPIAPGNDSLLTDDESLEMKTPTNKQIPEPTSAVKEKVQQFEEMATRVTRTKTRAMAKKEEPVQTDNQTPPDRTKPVISTDTLTKMNTLIFNGKPPQISSSASKPRTNIPMKTSVTASASKISAARDDERREKEDARRKKEAMLEAKKEMQRRKREEKMSAAAAARTAAENMRRAAIQAAERERRERQIQADQGRLDRLKEVEKKKMEQARKAAETEERRKLEEAARASRLQNEQRKMEEARKRQLEEEKIMKKEAAQWQREIERKQREFIERMKMKNLEGDRTPNKMAAIEPVYMQDGFQYLNSDEEEPPERPPPVWSTSKNRRIQLSIQSRISQHHIDRLFSVREHTPDLREIFPNIERARLKRTSSAVWRTPPRMATLDE